MKKIKVNSFEEYLEHINNIDKLGENIILFRGQSDNKPLLPSIARKNPKEDTTQLEIEMIEEFKRRSNLLLDKKIESDWEWLILAQHYGLKTRLLDWSSNPLVALWFASNNEYKMESNSFVYIFNTTDEFIINTKEQESPFNTPLTRILKPTLNNNRIVTQSGWFTAHKYNKKTKKFISLDKNTDTTKFITQIEINSNAKNDILKKLAIYGINNRTIYPDLIGLCAHLNWKYRDSI